MLTFHFVPIVLLSVCFVLFYSVFSSVWTDRSQLGVHTETISCVRAFVEQNSSNGYKMICAKRWRWTTRRDQAFAKSKSCYSTHSYWFTSTHLRKYDWCVTTDGIGAVMSHMRKERQRVVLSAYCNNGLCNCTLNDGYRTGTWPSLGSIMPDGSEKPVGFLSHTLTDTERIIHRF